jgi:hypothetical protein
MKKTDVFLKECVGKLSDDDLDFIVSRLDQNLQGDLSEWLTVLSKNYEIDRMLCSAKSTDEFYDTVDQIEDLVRKEYNRRKKSTKE